MPLDLDRPDDRTSFRERYGPWALVAGASEGIGAAFSEQLAGLGVHLVIVARRAEPLRALADDLASRFDVQVVAMPADLGSPTVAETLAPTLADKEVGLLVYNAAASTIGPFLDTSTESKVASVHVNCRGPVLLLPRLVEPMRTRGQGGVVLMSSLSGLAGTAMVATYAATKAFTQVLGEGLWEELGPHGIDVVVSTVGAVKTPGFLTRTPEARQGQARPLDPATVARDALENLPRGPVTVPGLFNRIAAFLLQRLFGRRRAVRFLSANTRAIYEK